MQIERVTVEDSTSVEEWAYLNGGPDENGINVAVRFKGTPSRWYVYEGLPGNTVVQLKAVGSVGSYVANQIKKGGYAHSIIEGINSLRLVTFGVFTQEPRLVHTSPRAGRFA